MELRSVCGAIFFGLMGNQILFEMLYVAKIIPSGRIHETNAWKFIGLQPVFVIMDVSRTVAGDGMYL